MNPIEVLGQERINLYNKMHYPVQRALDFFMHGDKSQIDNLIGSEFQFQTERQLKPVADHIESEVEVRNSSIDIVADISGFKHTYENKAVRVLNNKKVLNQIAKARGHYKGKEVLHHVVVLSDTKVSPEMEQQINSIGADVIRSCLTREDLLNELLNMQKLIRALN
jgi:hypothetical protein